MTTQFKQISPPLRIGERKKNLLIRYAHQEVQVSSSQKFVFFCSAFAAEGGRASEMKSLMHLLRGRHLLYNFYEKSKHSLKELTKFEGAQTVP